LPGEHGKNNEIKKEKKKETQQSKFTFKKTKKRVGIGLGRKEGKKRPLPFWEACLS